MSCQHEEKPAMPSSATAAAVSKPSAAESCGSAAPSSASATGCTAGHAAKEEMLGPLTKEMSYRDSSKKPSASGSMSTRSAAIGSEQQYDHQLLMPALAPAMTLFGRGRRSGEEDDDEEDDGSSCGPGDRLRNDLLDEICNDMGIHDSMDLDIIYEFHSGAGATSPTAAAYDERALGAAGSHNVQPIAGSSRHAASAPSRNAPPAGVAAVMPAQAVKREIAAAECVMPTVRHTMDSVGFAGATAAGNRSSAAPDAKVFAASDERGLSNASVPPCERQPMEYAGSRSSSTDQDSLEQRAASGVAAVTVTTATYNGTPYHQPQHRPSSQGYLVDDSRAGSGHSASPDLLSGLNRQGGNSATDDSKFSAAGAVVSQQHSSKAVLQRQQSRNDYSPYQVPVKQPPGGSAYYHGPATGGDGAAAMRRGASAMVDSNGSSGAPAQQHNPATAQPGWYDGSSIGTRWTLPSTPVGSHFEEAFVPSQSSFQDYPEDFSMEDLTAPDSTINFSEMPQQPNYYQVPEFSALPQSSQLNISFNMSLTSNQPVPIAQQQQQAAPPPLYHLPQSAGVSRPAAPGQFGKRQVTAPGGHSAPGQLAVQQQLSGMVNNGYSMVATAQQQQQMLQHQMLQQQRLAAPVPPSTSVNYRAQPYQNGPGGDLLNPAAAAGNPGVFSVPGPPNANHQGMVATMSAASTAAQSVPTAGKSVPVAPTTHDFMQRLVMDKSSAFRSHPLFPLLRDLIIADMNFEEPSFPHQLIRDLPSDFSKLLKNYLSRNPPRGTYQTNQSVESVVMDALRFAHRSLIDKIQQKRGGAPESPALRRQDEPPVVPPHCTGGSATLSDGSSQEAPECAAGASGFAPASLSGHGAADVDIKFDIGMKQSLEQADSFPAERSTADGRDHMTSGQYAMASALVPNSGYRQPLTVDTSCGLGGTQPPAAVANCYPSGRAMPPNAIAGRPFAGQRPPAALQQQGTGYGMQQTNASCGGSAYGSLAGAGDSSPLHRDSPCYYYGTTVDVFPQTYPAAAGQMGGMQQQQHRQHQTTAMPGMMQYNGGGGGSSGVCSPLYPQAAYAHMQNSAMSDRQQDINQMYMNGSSSADHMLKAAIDQGKMGRGYPANGGAGTAQCLDYGRAGSVGLGRSSSGGSMSDLLGMTSASSSSSSSCMGGSGSHLAHLAAGKLPMSQQVGAVSSAAAAEGATRKHQSLPKEAVSVMLSWLKDHQDKPYPNDDEKSALIKQTGLSITQINYWFTNARRRLLPKWRGEDM